MITDLLSIHIPNISKLLSCNYIKIPIILISIYPLLLLLAKIATKIIKGHPFVKNDRLTQLKFYPIFFNFHNQMNRAVDYHRKNWPDEGKFLIWLGITSLNIIYNAKEAKKVFKDYLNKSWNYKIAKDWIGKSAMAFANGQDWKNRRKCLAPSFHGKILTSTIGFMNNNAKIMVKNIFENIKSSKTNSYETDINIIFKQVTLDILCESSMGVSTESQLGKSTDYIKAIDNILHTWMCRFRKNPMLMSDILFKFSKLYQPYMASIKTVNEKVGKIVDMKISSFEETDETNNQIYKNSKHLTFIDILLEGYKTGNFTRDDIKHEIQTFMFAGHDTSGNAMSFCAYLLGRDEEEQKLVRKNISNCTPEIESFETMDDALDNLFLDDQNLINMDYLDAAIKESMRMYPPVPAIGREIPGTNIVAMLYFFQIMRDEAVWPEPLEFKPSRFLESNVDSFNWVPFAAGPRDCVGKTFAMKEMKIVMGFLLKFFTIESLLSREQLEERLVDNGILTVEGGIPIRIKIRDEYSKFLND